VVWHLQLALGSIAEYRSLVSYEGSDCAFPILVLEAPLGSYGRSSRCGHNRFIDLLPAPRPASEGRQDEQVDPSSSTNGVLTWKRCWRFGQRTMAGDEAQAMPLSKPRQIACAWRGDRAAVSTIP
jgi:hypothetical protein